MTEAHPGPVSAAGEQRVPRYTSYPTAPHFHAGIGREAYGRWLAGLPAGMPLSLYLHVPFCDSMCWFCGCHTKIVQRYAPVADYLDALLAEIDLVADTIGRHQPVSHIHWGGGTPTMLAPADIIRLATRLRARFEVASDAEFAVEIDPRELSAESVDALGTAGVNRASLGVQDVNPDVQAAINRIQPIEATRLAVDRLRAAGVHAINIDLMYGLPHQTEAHVTATIDAVMTLSPERLSLFGYAHLPSFKTHQKMIDEASLPDATARWRQAAVAAERLRALGYVPIGLDHFAKPDDPLARAQRDGNLRRNFQGYTTDRAEALIGLGASAIGSLPQGYVQNAVPLRGYRETVAAGHLATARGFALSDEDRLRREVIERLMCDQAADLGALCRRHGRSAGHFAPELAGLAKMERDGIVDIDGLVVRIPQGARPLMRLVAAEFDAYLARSTAAHAKAV
jgi:oxygen-independent coproporphyrinogen-3 oxidase